MKASCIKYVISNTHVNTGVTIAYLYSFPEINYSKLSSSLLLTTSEAQKNCSEAYVGAKDIKIHTEQ